MRLGYNTNGLAHHRLDDALRLLADLGYEGVAITLDVGHLDPLRATAAEVESVRALCERLGLAVAVETGARFVLDPARKHFPTLLEDAAEDRARRVEFLVRSARIAADLGAGVVSIWSGRAPRGCTGDGPDPSGANEPEWERLTRGVAEVLERTEPFGVTLAFEPEPGMFVERPIGFHVLRRRLERAGAPLQRFALTLDVGHLLCTGDLPVERAIAEAAPHLAHVHLDDVADGVHVHRMFGEGDLDLPATLLTLREVGFSGMAAVELSRDSHRGAEAAAEALRHLRGPGPARW
ncbi:MAG: sugar phosphate isomerase/epimerase family protein [Planctomycetota bacterium]